ncbi:hypothetical protein HK101_001612 [Irineochytrium annulatum]|nr:hypothetical protein HK101_001612 [Irineochytrium annulatum]
MGSPHSTGLAPDGISLFDETASSADYAKHSFMVKHLFKACRARGWLDSSEDDGVVSLRVTDPSSGTPLAGSYNPTTPGTPTVASSRSSFASGSGTEGGGGGAADDIAASPVASSKASTSGAESPFSARRASFASGRGSDAMYVTYPAPNEDFASAVKGLNVEVAIMLTSHLIRSAIDMVPDENSDLKLRDGSKMQVLECLDDLPGAKKLQYAALLKEEGCLVVWATSVDTIIDTAAQVQEQLVKVVWGGLPQPLEGEKKDDAGVEEFTSLTQATPAELKKLEKLKKHGRTRPIHFVGPIIAIAAISLTLILSGLAVATVLHECFVDRTWIRLSLLSVLPMEIVFTMFLCTATVTCIFYLVGPIKQIDGNSQFYSGKPPKRIDRGWLPHITIQMPVYTESLDGVLAPTIQSLQRAISTYERQGGTASIFVNEDGMQVIPEREAEARRRFYAENNIGWVARPKHNADGFIRKGRFKKASNMNFCLMISRNLEKLLDERPEMDYDEALDAVLREDGRAWAAGDIQMGDYLLIVDSDTRVPDDCLLDAANEFIECPEVAIIQHMATPMVVTYNYFEMGVAYFTRLIYASIKYATASGEIAPFVGHNAFLRWSAIKEVGFEEDDVVKYWSESHVSEDFDMALRLQVKGYLVRFAAYCGDGFQEGVSLSVYDEIGRWQKYAYGCSELVFHPLKYWLTRGPFTPLFRKFLFSNMNFNSKVVIVGYIGSYYAIGSAWILTLVTYFLLGFFDTVDEFYLPSYDILVTTVLVFTFLSNLGFAVLRYRLKECNFFWALWENFCWVPFFCIFFSGLSFHCSLALVSHMIGYNMQWGTTAKELENSNFFKEVPKVLGGYKRMYIIFMLLIVMLPVMVYVPPAGWNITDFTLIMPAALSFVGHLICPIALNPGLMTFSF